MLTAFLIPHSAHENAPDIAAFAAAMISDTPSEIKVDPNIPPESPARHTPATICATPNRPTVSTAVHGMVFFSTMVKSLFSPCVLAFLIAGLYDLRSEGNMGDKTGVVAHTEVIAVL